MADDILGHEHLDHGKHLHKGPNAHGHGHHGHGAHGHKPRTGAAHVGVLALRRKQPRAHHDEHETHVEPAKPLARYRLWIGLGLGGVVLLAFLAWSAPALALLAAFLAVDVLLELHKLFTGSLPIDIEILYGGVAFLSAHYGVAWGIVLALIGPSVAALVRSHYCEEELIKTVALLISAIAALLFGPAPGSLLVAAAFGIVAQFAAVSGLGLQPSFNNAFARLTATAVNAYVLVLLLPSVLHG